MIKNMLTRRKESNIFYHFTFPGFPILLIYRFQTPLKGGEKNNSTESE